METSLGLEFEYWMVDALGKNATKLDWQLPHHPKSALFTEGRLINEVMDFYDGRIIEKVKGNYTEQQIMETFYKL